MKQLADYFIHSRQFYHLLLDADGNTSSANHLFTEHFGIDAGRNITLSVFPLDSPAEAVHLLEVIRQSLREPGVVRQVKLHLQKRDGSLMDGVWECSAFTSDNGIPLLVQCIAYAGVEQTGLRSLTSRVAQDRSLERYMALEHSAEGLWMLVSDKPVSLDQPADAILQYWFEHSTLVECNDNMARMYGFEKAEELIGVKLGAILDVHDEEQFNGFRRFIENGFTTTTLETREFDREGRVKYFQNRITGIVEDNKLMRVWGTQQDITAQRVAEIKLKESELFFRNLFVNSLDGIMITDENGTITFVSPSVTPILGYEADEVIGLNCFSFAHPEDRELARLSFDAERMHQTNVEFISLRVRKKSGEWMWCIIRGHNLFDNPTLKGMVVNFYNDTVRKRTEKALQESESRFRYQATILNNVTDLIATTDLERVVTSWNHMMEQLTGIPESGAIGKPFRYVVELDYSPFTNEQVISIVSTHGIWKGEVSFTGINGERSYFLTTISLMRNEAGKRIGLMAVGKDITDRKNVEQQLRESEQFYRNMIANSLDGIVHTDPYGIIRYSSPSNKNLTGYEAEELLGRSIFDFVHPDDIKNARLAFDLEYKGEATVNYISLRLRHASGIWVWCSIRGHNQMNHPVFNAMIIYFTDESKRKGIEDKLRESEQRFRSLFYNVQMGVTMRDPAGKLIMANKAAEKMLGVEHKDLQYSFVNTDTWNAVYEDGTPMPVDAHPVPVSIRTGEPVRGVVMGVHRKKFNDRVWIMVNTEPVMNEEGRLIYVICSFMDITEQKRLAQQLIDQEIQKQKQVTQATIDAQEKERIEIGKELHDNINQHLNTTRLYLEVAREKASGDLLEMIQLAHKNLSGIIHEIRQLSQSLVPPTLGDLGLAESVQDLCDALKRAHKFNIEFNSRHFFEEEIPENLRLSLFRIIQEKISNIIRHADATHISIKLQTDAEHIFLTITDNGKGFDPRNVKAGLGLSNIRTRTALFNGKMEIESAPGVGCTLSVIIPHHRESDGD